MQRQLLIRGIEGLGDAILQRPFVRAAIARWPEVYLETAWPQVYKDMPTLKVVRNRTPLYVYRKNMDRFLGWSTIAGTHDLIHLSFAQSHKGFQATLGEQLPLENTPYLFDIPDFGPCPIEHGGRPLAVVRPVTLRTEWTGPSRNPKPEYIALIAARLMATHYVVAIGDTEPGREWLVGDCPPNHLALLKGELSVEKLLALIQHASICVGGVGFMTVAAIAARTPIYTVLGGLGRHNSIERITDPRMDLACAGFAVPDNFCLCDKLDHDCDKTITGLLPKFAAWWANVTAAAH